MYLDSGKAARGSPDRLVRSGEPALHPLEELPDVISLQWMQGGLAWIEGGSRMAGLGGTLKPKSETRTLQPKLRPLNFER